MIMDDPGANCSVVPNSNAFSVHQHLSEASRLFQQGSYQTAAGSGVVSPFGGHLGGHPGAMQHHHHHPHAAAHHQGVHPSQAQQHHPHGSAAAVMQAMGGPPHGMGQMPHGLAGTSQSIAAALFANSPLISDDLKLAAAAAAAAQSARGKKTHRAEPVPQSGFKGVSWNSRMKAWLAFYVTENGERKSKTFSTRKLGMEEARIQAIAFCKQKQDQRREARKRNREMQNQHCNGLDKLSSDESMMDSPASGLGHLGQGSAGGPSSSSAQQASMRCGYPTTPGMGMMAPQAPQQAVAPVGQASSGSEIAYVPIVPIAMDMIEKSGLLQPLELNVLPPCQHCNKQPYPFLMIVSEGQEQTYSGSSIMSVAAHGQPGNGSPGCVPPSLDGSQANDLDNVGNVSSPASDTAGDVKGEPSGAGTEDHQSGGYNVLGQVKVSSSDSGPGADVHCGYSLGPHGLSSESGELARLAQLVHHHPGLDTHGGRDEDSGLSPSASSLMD